MSEPRKIPAACTLCDEPVFEIMQVHTNGPLKGHPIRVGKPLENAIRATLLLTNGTQMDQTYCEDCVPKIEADLPKIWKKTLEAFRFEREVIRPFSSKPLNAEQKAHDDKTMLEIASNPPIGVLAVRRWEDAARG